MENLYSKIASAFVLISKNIIESYKEDMLYELPKCLKALDNGETFVLTVRRTGADSIERFMDCLGEEQEKSYTNAIKYALSTIGVEFVVLFQILEGDVHLTFRSDSCNELPKSISDALIDRGIQFDFYNGLLF